MWNVHIYTDMKLTRREMKAYWRPLVVTGEIMRTGFPSAVGGRASWERQIRLQILHRDIQDLARLIISTNRPKKGWEDKQRKKMSAPWPFPFIGQPTHFNAERLRDVAWKSAVCHFYGAGMWLPCSVPDSCGAARSRNLIPCRPESAEALPWLD